MRYRFADFELDDRLFTLRRGGAEVPVRRQILDLILYLVRERDRVVTRPEIHAHLWPDAAVGGNSLATAINEARSALGDDGQSQAVIDTVYGRGYRFLPDVEEVRDEPLRSLVDPAEATVRFGVLGRLFVGRDDLLARLEATLRRAAEGDWRLVLLSGEMGIGKSRLVDELAARAQRSGVGVVLGRCEGESGAPSFWPWTQVIRQLCEAHSDAQLREFMGPGAAELAQIAPEVRDRLPGLSPSPRLEGEPARFRLFDSVVQFVRRCAERQPLLLVLEDLHAGDASSLELLRFLARSTGSPRLLALATFRDAELHRDPERHRVLGDLVHQPRVESCAVAGLELDDVARFVESAIAALPSDEVVAELHRRTSGNPFFLRHLVLTVAGLSGAEALARRPEALSALPATLREAIQGQIERLPERCQRLLGQASVIGRDFSLSLLEGLTEWPRESVLGELQIAMDAGVLSVHPERIAHYRFAHMMVRDALYESLPELARARLHERVGRALEQLYGAERHRILSELAHHAHQAVRLGQEERALALSLEAAEAAAARMGHSEAAGLLARALELIEGQGGDDGRRCDVLIRLGEAQTRAGRRDAAQATIERATGLARAMGDARRLARAALALEAGFFAIETGHVDVELIALLEEALEALDESDENAPLEAHLIARLTQARHWWVDAPEEGAWAARAERLATRRSDPSTRMHAVSAIHAGLWSPECLDERLARARDVIELAENEADWETALLHRLFLITGLMEKGDMEALPRERLAFESLATRLRQPQSAWYATMFECGDALREGRFDAVEPLAIAFLGVARVADDRNAVQSFGSCLTYLRWQTGRLREVRDLFEQLATRFESFPPWRCARAAVLAELGQPEAALGWVEGTRACTDPTRRDSSWLVTNVLAAHAASIAGEPAICARLYDALAPFEERIGIIGLGTLCWGSVAGSLGRLASALERWDAADAHFERALARNAAIGARPWRAQAAVDRAAAWWRRGDSEGRARARDGLEETLLEVRALGMVTLEAQVVGMLEKIG